MTTKQVRFDIELPEDLIDSLEEMDKQAKEAFVLDLLRQKKISQGKAAELLNVDRWVLADIMKKHGILSLVIKPEELDEGLKKLYTMKW